MSLFLALFVLGSVNAVDDNETYLLANNNGEGSFQDLETEIGDGGNVSLSKSRYSVDSGNTISITQSGTIDGNGTVIDMLGSNFQLFRVNAIGVNFRNITFVNSNYNRDGGVIYFENTGNIEYCTFINNTAGNGGAVFCQSNATVNYCVFINNTAEYSGGALYLDPASNYGTIKNSIFTNNTVNRGEGGAININKGEIEYSTFINNAAVNDGGAVYFNDDGEVNYCNFNNSIALGDGGAIFFKRNGNVSYSNFNKGSAFHGGGIFVGASSYISHSNFTNGLSELCSGAIFFNRLGTFYEILECNFINNTGAYGGAVRFTNGGTVINSTFIGNTAEVSGGGLYFYGNNATGYVYGSTFINNSALGENLTSGGGAIKFQYEGNVYDSVFMGNNASGGSAIYFSKTSFNSSINDSLFLNNRANSVSMDLNKEDDTINILFTGGNNLLNAIYSNNKVAFKNTTYWGVNGTANTDDSPVYYSIREAGQNITIIFYREGEVILDTVEVTDINGSISFNSPFDANYLLEVSHNNDLYYTEITNTLEVPKLDVEIDVSDVEINVDDVAVINVTVPAVLYGQTIYAEVNGKNKSAIVDVYGKTSIPFSDLANGTYEVIVSYPGDDIYSSNSTAAKIFVNKNVPSISANNVTIFVGNNAELIINGPNDRFGDIVVAVNESFYYSPMINGEAKVIIKDLDVGDYPVGVLYLENDKYIKTDIVTSISVKSKIDPSLIVNITVDDDSHNAEINVELPKNASGNVTVVIDGKKYPVKDLVNGTAVIKAENLSVGNHIAEVIYSGDETYNALTTYTNFCIEKISDYEFELIAGDIEKGEALNITVVLPEDVNGKVLIDLNGIGYYINVTNGIGLFNGTIDLPAGKYDVRATFEGDDKYASKVSNDSFEVNDTTHELIITAPDVIKYYSGSERFVVYFKDQYGKNVDGISVKITINGMAYKRTSSDGEASIAINLNSGNYTVNVEFAGTSEYGPQNITSNVEILPTIYGSDVYKVFRNGTQYYALFLDGEGNPLAKTSVTFNINGVIYSRTTDAYGWAKLNINLGEGKYILTAINPVTGEMKSNYVVVISKIESSDLVKTYNDKSQFTARILADDGSYVGAGEAVTFNINGVIYNKHTNSTGHVLLNINLMPGKYIITSYYKDCAKSNIITVLAPKN